MSEKRSLSAERIKELKNRPIDLSDIPEISDSMWDTGHYRNWKPTKKAISGRIYLINDGSDDKGNKDWTTAESRDAQGSGGRFKEAHQV